MSVTNQEYWDKATDALEKPLDPNNVKLAASGNNGPKGDYIEGWHAINEANRIFGFGGWSYEVAKLNEVGQAEKNQKGNWSVSYICQIKVIVGSVTREDVGFGSGFARNIGDAHESATKEACTDALKRALRSFGNQFGLALYDKTRANVEAPAKEKPPEKTPQQIKAKSLSDELKAITTEAGFKSFWADNSKEIGTFPQKTQDYFINLFNEKEAGFAQDHPFQEAAE